MDQVYLIGTGDEWRSVGTDGGDSVAEQRSGVSESQHFRSPSYVLMAHSVGYNPMAIALGTISDGTTNYASGVTTDASLASSKGGTLYFGDNSSEEQGRLYGRPCSL
jgi:hypothetical protein